METLLFLDFNGVLQLPTEPEKLAFNKAKNLAQLLIKNSDTVVISSSWRFHHTLENIKDRLPTILQELVIDTTGETCFGKWPRFNEIKNYMVQRNICTTWRALDDSFMEFPYLCEQLVVCNPNTGITDTELMQM